MIELRTSATPPRRTWDRAQSAARLGVAFAWTVLVLGACAPIVPQSKSAAPPAAARDTVSKAPASAAATARPTSPTSPPTTGAVDLQPSADAREVLDSIPEPLAPNERIPAESGGGAPDTSGAVPVPAPSLALGQQPQRSPADSLAAPTGAASPGAVPPPTSAPSPSGSAAGASGVAAAPPAGAAPSKAPPATPDTCWRVQVAAPEEREKGEQLRSVAESVLLVPMVVELEKKLYKVRTRDCMSQDVAARLKARAEGSGFEGAFRFVSPPAPAKKGAG